MAGIYTRKAVQAILERDELTPEEKVDQLFSLHGRAIDDGYVTKMASNASRDEAVKDAVEKAKAEFKAPDVKESQEYKDLQRAFDDFKVRTDARGSADYADVKGKFFDTVYDMIDRSETAKPIAEQLSGIKEKYEEYFNAETPKGTPVKTPQFSQGQAKGGYEPTAEDKARSDLRALFGLTKG
jgi:hypothetical protein